MKVTAKKHRRGGAAERERKQVWVSNAEIQRWVREIGDPQLRLLVGIAAASRVRPADLISLRLKDIDFEQLSVARRPRR